MTLTETELREEWTLVYQTRLGILCANQEPTALQEQMALKEADEMVEGLRKINEPKR